MADEEEDIVPPSDAESEPAPLRDHALPTRVESIRMDHQHHHHSSVSGLLSVPVFEGSELVGEMYPPMKRRRRDSIPINDLSLLIHDPTHPPSACASPIAFSALGMDQMINIKDSFVLPHAVELESIEVSVELESQPIYQRSYSFDPHPPSASHSMNHHSSIISTEGTMGSKRRMTVSQDLSHYQQQQQQQQQPQQRRRRRKSSISGQLKRWLESDTWN
jgi:hypothetical protein